MLDISAVGTPWKVTFPPDLGAPASIELPALAPLHEHADPGVRHFSGTASYQTSFSYPGHPANDNSPRFLDLGTVFGVAEVVLNGHPAGVLWSEPRRLDVSKLLHPGENLLEIQVTNTWDNRVLGEIAELGEQAARSPARPDWLGSALAPPDRPIFFQGLKTLPDSLQPSGLLGPVKILATQP